MNKKALVVDNDYFFVEFLSELLAEKRYDVVKAYDGKEAIDRLEQETVDLMFADIVMPKVDGWQLIKTVRRRFSDSLFPIVAVSGTIVEQLDELEQIGADYYIIKGPLEKMKSQILQFLDDLASHGPDRGDEKLIYDPGNIYPRRESSELIESIQFHKAIFESIAFGLVVVDRDGSIMLVNERAATIFERSAAEMLNRPAPSILPGGAQKRLVDVMRRIVQHPEVGGLSCSSLFGKKRVRMLVSLLTAEGQKSGWVIAAEETAA